MDDAAVCRVRDGGAYVQACVDRGTNVDAFAPRLSFFFNCHNDFFVVNKADQPGADRLATAVKHTCDDDKPVVQTTASRGEAASQYLKSWI